MKNRFNNLTSKEWLPFQKSWFIFKNDSQLYKEYLRFFIKFDHDDWPPTCYYYSSDPERTATMQQVADKVRARLYTGADVEQADVLQFALFDIRGVFTKGISLPAFKAVKKDLLANIYSLKHKLAHRRFVVVLVDQYWHDDAYFPIAWDLARTIASTYSLKDEKIGCTNGGTPTLANGTLFRTANDLFYALHFRNDENSQHSDSFDTHAYFVNNRQTPSDLSFTAPFPGWFILKPPPRKKNEILHPAKYPEDLVEKYVRIFTHEGENVFDPMSGTGSTQLTALQLGRNGYGTELSEFFCNIANERCREYLTRSKEVHNGSTFRIELKDVRQIASGDFPLFDYIITSPPYWDMLNMKGAEYQARRREKGLQLNYSDDDADLGNIDDYARFLDELVDIYFSLIDHLKPGRFMTIVVKNIKKKGKNYPLAWDLAERLQHRLILLPESFWLQDDISIAPYGYGNTFVSNTFHHYCLTFQKPV